MIHDLKLLDRYYNDVYHGVKPFEVRKNDRDYKVGDYCHFYSFDGVEYTGYHFMMQITYVLSDSNYCKDGFVILGLKGCK